MTMIKILLLLLVASKTLSSSSSVVVKMAQKNSDEEESDEEEEASGGNPLQSAATIFSELIEHQFLHHCPVARSRDMIVELLLRDSLSSPIKVDVSIILYHLHEINDLTKSLSLFLNAKFEWELPCPTIHTKELPEMKVGRRSHVIEESMKPMITFTKNLTDIWYPLILHLNAVKDVNFIQRLTDTIRIFPLTQPPTARAAGFGMIESSCDEFAYAKFPFDTLKFSLALEPSYSTDLVSFAVDNIYYAIDPSTQFLAQADVWYVCEPVSYQVVNKTNTINGRFQVIYFTITLRRKPSYYLGVIFLPMVTLTALQIISLLMRPSLPDRSTFCMTVVLSMSVILSIAYGIIPQTSETIYLITMIQAKLVICTFVTCYTLLSCYVSAKRWAQDTVCFFLGGAVSAVRLTDIVVAMTTGLAIGLTYIVCLGHMLDID